MRIDFSPKSAGMTKSCPGAWDRRFIAKSAFENRPSRHFITSTRPPDFDFKPKTSAPRPGTLPGATLGHSGRFWRKVDFHPILLRKSPFKIASQGILSLRRDRRTAISSPKRRPHAPGRSPRQFWVIPGDFREKSIFTQFY